MTPLLTLSILIFITTAGIVVSAFYLLIEAPAARKRMRNRLEGIHQSYFEPEAASGTTIMRGVSLSNAPMLNRILLDIPLLTRTQASLQQAAMKMTVAELLTISLASALFVLVVMLVTQSSILWTIPLCLGAAALPFLVVSYRARRRAAKFEETFPDALDMLARAVRAGHPITTSLQLIASEMSDPVAGEFRLTFDQQNLGLPLRDAFYNLSVRMPLPDVKVFVTVLQIQRETGGNLAEILDNVADVIRERFKLHRQIRVITAEGRLTMTMLMAIPPAAALLFYLTNPEYMMPLIKDPLGNRLIGVAIVMQTLGCLVIRKIIRIKV